MNTMSKIIEALKWRYATKQFDTEQKLSAEQLATLKEALRLAPSSFGLQPWHFIVVENPELRARLRAAGYDQPQITEASHFVVLAIEKNIDAALVDKYLKSIAETRKIPLADLEGFRTMLNGALTMKPEAERRDWATRQVYIALGVLLTTAALEHIDAAPMEGFDPRQFDEILDLEKQNLESRAIVGLGFRREEDLAASMPKVRYSEEEVFTTL